MDLSAFLERLTKTRKLSEGGYVALCPAHDDKNPSLSVTQGQGGRILVHCHAGCQAEEVTQAMGLTLSDLMPESTRTRSRNNPEISYDYCDESGRLLYQAVRSWTTKGKTFKQRRPSGDMGSPNGNSWSYSLAGVRRVLYRLPEVIAAAEKNQAVFVVEGEKDAEALRRHGLVATTNAGGAKSWRREFAESLQGTDILVVPHCDEAGEKHLESVLQSLKTTARRLGVVRLGLGPGGDVSDYLLRHGFDAFVNLVRSTELYACDAIAESVSQVSQRGKKTHTNGLNGTEKAVFGCDSPVTTTPDVVTKKASRVTIIAAHDFLKVEFPPIQWIVPNIIPEGLTMLAGKPKSGKSWLALNIAHAVSCGGYALGKVRVDQGRALYVNCDSGQREFHKRIRAFDGLPQTLDLAFSWPKLDDGGLDELVLYLDSRPDTRLVVIDTLYKVRGQQDTRKRLYDEDYNSLDGLANIARERSIGIIVIHHANKIRDAEDPFDMISGSTGLTAAVDTGAVLRDIPAGTALFIKGKEIPQTDLALTRDPHVGTWTLQGDVEAFNFTSIWQQIMDAIRDGLQSPRDIADFTGISHDTVRQTLVRMLKEGRVRRADRGKYVLRERLSL